VGAIDYLERELASPDVFPTSRETVLRGAARLDSLAHSHGATSFGSVPEASREALLRAFEMEEGSQDWFETMLAFTLEAFLGDPIHGGNPGEVAWRWLGYTPPFPRPGEAQ
jgi:hypothetical protein